MAARVELGSRFAHRTGKHANGVRHVAGARLRRAVHERSDKALVLFEQSGVRRVRKAERVRHELRKVGWRRVTG